MHILIYDILYIDICIYIYQYKTGYICLYAQSYNDIQSGTKALVLPTKGLVTII